MKTLLTYRNRLLNTVVMDYFVQKGYSDAAAAFAKEANMDLRHESDLMDENERIRSAIYAGDIQKAIEEVNEIDEQVRFPLPPYTLLQYDDIGFHAPLITLRRFDDSKHRLQSSV